VYKVEHVSKQQSHHIMQLHLTVQNDDDDDVCCVCEEEQLNEEQILYHAK
jgi:hypothetical protein